MDDGTHFQGGQSRYGPLYRDTRDFTPFRDGHVRTHVRDLADGLGDAIAGAMSARSPRRIAVFGDIPRLKRRAGKTAKDVCEAVFTSTEPERLIALARANPGWAGLCYVMAGLLAYKHGGYQRASELLQRGLSLRIDDDASQFSANYLGTVVTRVEVGERVDIPVLFSEESVFLALSHCLRETGRTAEALDALGTLPPSLPHALARCTAAAALGRHRDIVDWTDGLLNADDLSAALLLIRARSLRALGAYGGANAALKEVLRRKKTSLTLRNDAVTDRALLALDAGRMTLAARPWQRPNPADVETVDGISKDVEVRRMWKQQAGELGQESDDG